MAAAANPMAEAMRLHQAGRLAEAEALYRHILAARPGFAPALSYLGLLEHQAGRVDGLQHLKRAVALAPGIAVLWLNYGLALDGSGDLAGAEAAFRRALALDAALLEAVMALGSNLRRQGRIDDAIGHFQRAYALAPERPAVAVNLGGALNDAKRFDEARAVLEAGHRRAPDDPALNLNLGLVRANENDTEAAVAAFRQAAAARPGYWLAEWQAALTLPVIYERQADIAGWRERWAANLEELASRIDLSSRAPIDAALRAVWSSTNFHLHYQGADDRALQTRYAALVQRIVRARYPAFAEPVARRPGGERLRVGFLSHFFRHHSIAKTHGGWATALDRRNFEIFVIHTGSERDATTARIAAAVEHFHHRPVVDEALLAFLRALALDILIYPDIGMEPAYQVLAALRLAPIQCNGLGHPVTAGFDSIDVALSSAGMEPTDGDAHYRERLVRLANTGFRYRRPAIEQTAPFERGTAETVYVCAQNLTKLLPGRDELFARIAAAVPGSAFWFMSHHSSAVTRQFEARLAAAFAAAGAEPAGRIRMLPRLPQQAFYGMYRAADICLDSHDWSGCNTTYEALACGLPVITWSGPMMRGRHSRAILAQAGLDMLIQPTADTYVELAIRLGLDRALRRETAATARERAERVFHDPQPIAGLAAFLQEAAGSVW